MTTISIPARSGLAGNLNAADEHEEDSCAVREHVSRLPSHIRSGRSGRL
jgi:hypothetical protein